MPKQLAAKRERIIEAIRHGLEGDAAVEFVRQSGFAMNGPGIARHLRAMGGKGLIQELILAGKSNHEVLAEVCPEEAVEVPPPPPEQVDLFPGESSLPEWMPAPPAGAPFFETTKLTVKVPTELYEAMRIASRVEGKTINQLVVEIMTAALGRLPTSEDAESAL